MTRGAKTNPSRLHVPVLLEEAVQALRVMEDGVYIDATYGRGGHARAILDKLGGAGCLMVMDRDDAAVEHARQTLGDDPRCRIVHGELKNIDTEFAALSLERKADGVLADLGVSSPQLDDGDRGFSFSSDGPLDMRMDPEGELDAATWLNTVGEQELVQVLREYGEERYARRIARAVIEQRASTPLARTKQLADIVSNAVPKREKNKHPATRTFQAIRMLINAELDQLGAFLPKAVNLLAEGGRLAVISFHSLEDRLVKRFLRQLARGDVFPVDVPVTANQLRPLIKLVGKPCRPSALEVENNPRARSAVLRGAERSGHCHA